MDKQALLEMMKAQQDVYLAAWRVGYAKGWDDAFAAMQDHLKPKRTYNRQEKPNANE